MVLGDSFLGKYEPTKEILVNDGGLLQYTVTNARRSLFYATSKEYKPTKDPVKGNNKKVW